MPFDAETVLASVVAHQLQIGIELETILENVDSDWSTGSRKRIAEINDRLIAGVSDQIDVKDAKGIDLAVRDWLLTYFEEFKSRRKLFGE